MRNTTLNATIAIAGLSVIGAGAVGLLAPVTTPTGWLILAFAGTAPALLFRHYAKPPAQTISESIRDAIR